MWIWIWAPDFRWHGVWISVLRRIAIFPLFTGVILANMVWIYKIQAKQHVYMSIKSCCVPI
jgi:hypothetical protein